MNRNDQETRERQPKLIGASVAARRLGVPIDRVTADIKAGMFTGIGTADPFALTGGLLPLGYFVEAWELEGERLAYHQRRLAGGSAGTPK